jgi:hypothetical protein
METRPRICRNCGSICPIMVTLDGERAVKVESYCLVLTNDAYFQPEPPITAYAARFSAAMLDNDTAGQLARVE